MNREKYLADRKALMDEAQNLINEGKLEDAKAKMKKVEKLDSDYENAAREQANLNALVDRVSTTGMQNSAVGGVNGTVVASMGTESQEEDMFDSAEYKRAFQAHVLRGAAIPEKFLNVDANTKTTDVGTVIPTTTLQKIYEKMDKIGMVLPLVTNTGYKGGLSVPTSTVKPTASWVAEGAGSEKQKYATGSITFAYHKLRCAVSMSYEVDNMAYPMFETMFVNGVANAMVKAKETAIINGTGTGQPKGILKEAAAGNIDVAKGKSLTFAQICEAEGMQEDESAVWAMTKKTYMSQIQGMVDQNGQPKGILKEAAAGNIDVAKGKSLTFAQICEAEGMQEDESAVWAMTKKTYMSQIQGMVDQNGQPVARVNIGMNGRPEYTILGRPVVLLNKDYLASWSVAPDAAATIAFMYNFSDYIFNSGVPMAIKRYYDESVDDTICKAIEVCDGKSVRNDSLITVTLKNV